MRKLIFHIFIYSCFISCSKDESVNYDSLINQSKIDNVLAIKNIDEQRLTYSLLNEYEKNSLWKNKLEKVTDSKRLNSKQVKLIKEFENKLSPELFLEENDKAEYLKTVYISKFLEKLKKTFTDEQIGSMFYEVNPTGSEDYVRPDDDEPWCNCDIGAIFSCAWFQDACRTYRCDGTRTGCGFVWAWSCDGICSLI